MEYRSQDEYTNIPLSPPSSRAWNEWESWHTISTSQPHLNDSTDIDPAEDLRALSASLSSHIARAEEKRKTPIDEQTWEDWLDKSIATTTALLAEGKAALASEVSGVVGKVLAYEKSLQARKAGEIKGKRC